MAAALAAETARHPGPIRDAMTAGIKRWISAYQQMLADDGLDIDAHAAIATMVGALIMSRAMSDPDVADKFVSGARDTLLSLAQPRRKSPAKKRAKRARS